MGRARLTHEARDGWAVAVGGGVFRCVWKHHLLDLLLCCWSNVGVRS